MAEYISREAAIDWISELIKARYEWLSDARGEIQGLNAAMCGIEDIPAADVVEVRHGRWQWQAWAFFGCSVCHQLTEMESLRGMIVKYNYCPNCGAKMDGGADE